MWRFRPKIQPSTQLNRDDKPMKTHIPLDQSLRKYRPWFLAAAIYNLIWGSVNALFPSLYFDLIGMPQPLYPALWQVVGMFVLVYAPAYWWASQRPWTHRHLIYIGLLGKMLGPIGFVWSLIQGTLPLAFGWTILSNDLIWWPAFLLFLRDTVRLSNGTVANP